MRGILEGMGLGLCGYDYLWGYSFFGLRSFYLSVGFLGVVFVVARFSVSLIIPLAPPFLSTILPQSPFTPSSPQSFFHHTNRHYSPISCFFYLSVYLSYKVFMSLSSYIHISSTVLSSLKSKSSQSHVMLYKKEEESQKQNQEEK